MSYGQSYNSNKTSRSRAGTPANELAVKDKNSRQITFFIAVKIFLNKLVKNRTLKNKMQIKSIKYINKKKKPSYPTKK